MKARNKFSATLRNSNKRTDNHPAALTAKVGLRERVLEQIGAAAVFDAFGGGGELYRKVWHRCASYIGCDKTWYRDDRLMYVADSRRVMRAIDLQPFNIFDFDSYGSPWEHVTILCARRAVAPGERIGVMLTEGSGLKVNMGQLPYALALLAGLRPDIRGAAGAFGRVIDKAIVGMCRRLNCQIVSRWEAYGKTGAGVIYIGLVLEGIRPAAETARVRRAARPRAAGADRSTDSPDAGGIAGLRRKPRRAVAEPAGSTTPEHPPATSPDAPPS